MIKAHQKVAGRAAVGLWVLALAVTVMALTSVGQVERWHVLQLPLLVLAGCSTLLSVLGRVIAPTRESYQLGYDAGLRDGARAMMSDRVVEFRDRRATPREPSLLH